MREHIFWGGLHLPASKGTEHFGVIGAPGSGKTKLLQFLMQSILLAIGSGRNRRAVIYDAKREMLQTLRGMGIYQERVRIMNPFDLRCHAWDMAADVDDPATATEIATILVPDKGDREPFFPEAARGLMSGVMEAFIMSARGRWTLRDVILGLRHAPRLQAILERSEATRHVSEKYLTGTDTQGDITATLENVARRLGFIAAAWDHTPPEQTISLQRWLQEESILLLGSHPMLESSVQQLNAALLHRLTQMILQGPEAETQAIPPQTWIVIDELRMAGRLPQLPGFLVQARSKGGCFAFGLQDLPGLMEVYGDNLAHELIGSIRNLAFLKIVETKTAQFASEVFGLHEVRRTTPRASWSWGSTISRSDRSSSYSYNLALDSQILTPQLVLPRQFKQIPDACRENGIGGYFDCLSLSNPYYHTIDGEFVAGQLCQPLLGVENLVPRPREHQYLRDWDKTDLERLGLLGDAKLILGSSTSKSRKKAGPAPGRKPKRNNNKRQALLNLLPTKP